MLLTSYSCCSGIRKDHCWAQWNLGRETTKDRGHSHGEVSRRGNHSFPLPPWILNLNTPLLLLVPLVWQLHRSSVCFCTLRAIFLTLSTCPSHFLWTHSVFPLSFLSSHSAAQMMLWHSPPPHCSVICFCRCQMCYSIHSPHCSSLLCHSYLLSLCIRYEYSTFFFKFSSYFFLPPQGGLTGWNGCGNPWRWGHFRCLLS